MMRLLYRFMNARFVERLYVQWGFETSFGAEAMRRGRVAINTSPLSRPVRQGENK